MLAFEPLQKVLNVATEARIEAAALQLMTSTAMRSAADVLTALRTSGVIGEEMAARLALKLNDQLVQSSRGNGAKEIEPPVLEGPKELPEPEPEPEVKPEPKAKRRRGETTSVDADVVRYCPICLEEGKRTRLSVGSCGCVKHWREVKKRQAGGR